MTRFRIQWAPGLDRWLVIDGDEGDVIAADFGSLLEAETYVLERTARSEQ